MKYFDFKKSSELAEYGKAAMHLVNQIIEESEKKEIPSGLLFTALCNIILRMLASQPIEISIEFGEQLPSMVLDYKKENESQ